MENKYKMILDELANLVREGDKKLILAFDVSRIALCVRNGNVNHNVGASRRRVCHDIANTYNLAVIRYFMCVGTAREDLLFTIHLVSTDGGDNDYELSISVDGVRSKSFVIEVMDKGDVDLRQYILEWQEEVEEKLADATKQLDEIVKDLRDDIRTKMFVNDCKIAVTDEWEGGLELVIERGGVRSSLALISILQEALSW